MNPIPTELIEFLEIEQHYRDYYSRQAPVTASAAVVTPAQLIAVEDSKNDTVNELNNNSNDKDNTTSNTTSNTASNTVNNTTKATTTTNNNRNSSTSNNSNDDSKQTKNVIQSNALTDKKMMDVLSSTLIYTTITYILCILLGIVDIRNTTIMKVLLTILALTLVVVFVRISFLGDKEKTS